jgi:hypothetical protein
MRKDGTGAGGPAGHRPRPSFFLFLPPEGGEKTKLGGELRREEQLISRTGMCMYRVLLGTVDDLSKWVFGMPFPPSSGTTGVKRERRSCRSDPTNTSLDPSPGGKCQWWDVSDCLNHSF